MTDLAHFTVIEILLALKLEGRSFPLEEPSNTDDGHLWKVMLKVRKAAQVNVYKMWMIVTGERRDETNRWYFNGTIKKKWNQIKLVNIKYIIYVLPVNIIGKSF